jgi:hypothetical protein
MDPRERQLVGCSSVAERTRRPVRPQGNCSTPMRSSRPVGARNRQNDAVTLLPVPSLCWANRTSPMDRDALDHE